MFPTLDVVRAGLLSRSSIGRSANVERVPTERSLWALAGQSGAAACSAASLQERFAARKAADLTQQAALAAAKAEGRTRDACRADPCNSAELKDVSKTLTKKGARGGQHGEPTCSSGRTEQRHCLQKQDHGKVASQAAMRVEALKEELLAAEATVVELKKYLAEAEAELEQEQQQMQKLQ